MRDETEIIIAASGAVGLNAKFDAASKEVFLNKEMIAPVLKNAVPEYKECTIDEVIACIDGESIISDPVDDVSAVIRDSGSNTGVAAMIGQLTETNQNVQNNQESQNNQNCRTPIIDNAVKIDNTDRVSNANKVSNTDKVNNTDKVSNADKANNAGIDAVPTEMSSVSEKLIRYDVRFKAVNPKLTTETIRFFLHIDLEVQNDYAPGYPIIKRAIYYAAREISSQLGILTHRTNYSALEKIYSIWICNDNIPEEIQNTVTSYSFTRSDIIGKTDEPVTDYDLMTVIMIRRGNDNGTEAIFDYLTGVFNSDRAKVSEYVDIDRNEKVKEAFEKMSGLGMSIAAKNYDKGVQQGRQQGMQQGMQQGIQQGIQQGRDQFAGLMQMLFDAGRIEDAKRAASVPAFRDQLMKEFAI